LKKAESYAYRLLARKARTERELAKKMFERGFDTLAIKEVVENFKKHNFINDSDYAQKLVERRLKQNCWGKRKIRQELIYKGIAEDVAEKIVNSIGVDEEYRMALISAQKKLKSLIKKATSVQGTRKNESENVLRKVILHLDRKGFSVEVIEQIYKNLQANIKGDKLDSNVKKLYNDSGRK